MAKEEKNISVVLHEDCDYRDWLVELKERFYSHRLKAACATNNYLLDFYKNTFSTFCEEADPKGLVSFLYRVS